MKAAALRTAGWGDEEEEGGETPPAADEPPLDALVEDVYQAVRDKVRKRIEDDLKAEEVEDALGPEDSTAWPNDTVHKEGTRRYVRLAAANAYRGAVNALVRTASSDVAFLDGLAELNGSFGIRVPLHVYRTALAVGPFDGYENVRHFLGACRDASGNALSPADVRVLVRIGKLLARLGSNNPPSSRRTT